MVLVVPTILSLGNYLFKMYVFLIHGKKVFFKVLLLNGKLYIYFYITNFKFVFNFMV